MAHHRAAAAFQEAERGAHGEGRAALLHRREVDLDAGLALVVERGFGEFRAERTVSSLASPKMKPGSFFSSGFLLRSVFTTPSSLLPAAGAP